MPFEPRARRLIRYVGFAALGFALLAAGSAAAAHLPPKVAIIKSGSIAQFEQAAAAIFEVLRGDPLQPELLTFDLEGEAANGPAVVRRALDTDPRLLVTVGSLATTAAIKTPSTVPIVFSMVLYPRESGFVSTPGRLVTGASLDISIATQFAYIRRLLPAAKRVGVLYSPIETGSIVEEARAVAAAASLTLVTEAVDEPSQAVAALGRLMERVDVVWSVADSNVFGSQTTPALLLAALRRGVPLIGLSPAHVRAGALAAFGSDYGDVGRQSGELAARVLRGESAPRPSITSPRVISLALNLRTASHLGLRIDPGLEAEAREVVK